MSAKNLLLKQYGEVTVITINRPDALNALNPETLKELDETFSEIEATPATKVIIITGAGDKAFVAGGDISVMQPLNPLQARTVARQAQHLFNRIEHSTKIVLAAINGYALGGGCELALACDIRLAADSAKLGQPEINLGIIPGWAGTQRLPRLIGKGKAKELMLTGNMISALQAEKLGLVNKVVPDDKLDGTCLEIAREYTKMCALKVSKYTTKLNCLRSVLRRKTRKKGWRHFSKRESPTGRTAEEQPSARLEV